MPSGGVPCRSPLFSRHSSQVLPRNCVARAIRARWGIDVRYGTKLEAVELVQEWVTDIASKAAGGLQRAEILSAAIGAPESRIELELSFASLGDLEVFWGSIPAAEHKKWSTRLQSVVIDGSPSWTVYRTVEASQSADSLVAAPQLASNQPQRPLTSSGSAIAQPTASTRLPRELRGVQMPQNMGRSAGGLSLVTSSLDAESILSFANNLDSWSQRSLDSAPPQPMPKARPPPRPPGTADADSFTSSRFVSMMADAQRASSPQTHNNTAGGETPAGGVGKGSKGDASIAETAGKAAEPVAGDGSGGVGGGVPFARDGDVVRDWKGDPIAINADDKLPFKFL